MSYPEFYNKKASVIIPCYNASEQLCFSLPFWLGQSYKNFDLIVVDYCSSSSVNADIMELSNRFLATINTDRNKSRSSYAEYDKITVLRLNDLGFNLSHAINYGVQYSTSDLVVIAYPSLLPDRSFLDMLFHVIRKELYCVCDEVLSFERSSWYKINGLQEFYSGDLAISDFMNRLELSNYCRFDIDSKMCVSFNSKMYNELFPMAYFDNINYGFQHGIIANYCLLPGQDSPVKFVDNPSNTIFISESKTKLPDIDLISTRCAYAGRLDDYRCFCIVPTAFKENLFVPEITDVSEIRSFDVEYGLSFILENINSIIDANPKLE